MAIKPFNSFKHSRKNTNDLLDKMIEHFEKTPDMLNLIELTYAFNMTHDYFLNLPTQLSDEAWVAEVEAKIETLKNLALIKRMKKAEGSTNQAWQIFLMKVNHNMNDTKNINIDQKVDGDINVHIKYDDYIDEEDDTDEDEEF